MRKIVSYCLIQKRTNKTSPTATFVATGCFQAVLAHKDEQKQCPAVSLRLGGTWCPRGPGQSSRGRGVTGRILGCAGHSAACRLTTHLCRTREKVYQAQETSTGMHPDQNTAQAHARLDLLSHQAEGTGESGQVTCWTARLKLAPEPGYSGPNLTRLKGTN